MSIRAMDYRCCEIHGEKTLHHYGKCCSCFKAHIPKPIVIPGISESVNRVRRYRARLRMAKMREGKRTAAMERAAREKRWFAPIGVE